MVDVMIQNIESRKNMVQDLPAGVAVIPVPIHDCWLPLTFAAKIDDDSMCSAAAEHNWAQWQKLCYMKCL